MMKKEQDIKIVILGSSGVGKTSILTRLSDKPFSDNSQTTLGSSYVPKILTIGEKTFKLQIWDTAGQEKYHSLAPLYYRDSHAAIVVYDITNKISFEVLKHWISELKQHGPPNIVIGVVGNKSDLVQQEEVDYETSQAYARDLNAVFSLTSAKTNQNIESLFLSIVQKVSEQDLTVQIKPNNIKGIKKSKKPEKKPCCGGGA